MPDTIPFVHRPVRIYICVCHTYSHVHHDDAMLNPHCTHTKFVINLYVCHGPTKQQIFPIKKKTHKIKIRSEWEGSIMQKYYVCTRHHYTTTPNNNNRRSKHLHSFIRVLLIWNRLDAVHSIPWKRNNKIKFICETKYFSMVQFIVCDKFNWFLWRYSLT